MREKLTIVSNAFLLTVLGVRIELYNRLLTELFRKRKLIFLCGYIDSRLLSLRKDFLMLERRHRSFICLDI